MNMPARVDEVEKYYKPVENSDRLGKALFWLLIALSFVQIFKAAFSETIEIAATIAFLIAAIAAVTNSLISRLYLTPRAERARRKQNLSNAFGTCLSSENTSLYYNNQFKHSILKLGANTFENSFFSKEVATNMLVSARLIFGCYFVIWFVVIAVRQTDLNLITWITQILFSGDVIGYWISLELLRHRHEKVFERYHEFFLHRIDHDTPEGMAVTIDIFSEYESAKAASGIKLNSEIFHKLNPSLSKEWESIKTKLKMNPNQDASTSNPGIID